MTHDQPTQNSRTNTHISQAAASSPYQSHLWAQPLLAIAGSSASHPYACRWAATIYTTGVGEQKTIQLADNSIVQLNTNSRLEVDYSDTYSRLNLTRAKPTST